MSSKSELGMGSNFLGYGSKGLEIALNIKTGIKKSPQQYILKLNNSTLVVMSTLQKFIQATESIFKKGLNESVSPKSMDAVQKLSWQ